MRFWFQYGPTLGIFGCVALMFVAGWRGKGYLESKGYGRLASGSIRFQLGLVVRRRLIERLPRFEEIEHTPYNNPNDPAALHRILDDLAAQMEEDGPKRPETGLSRL